MRLSVLTLVDSMCRGSVPLREGWIGEGLWAHGRV